MNVYYLLFDRNDNRTQIHTTAKWGEVGRAEDTDGSSNWGVTSLVPLRPFDG